MNSLTHMNKCHGFTLVELITVMVITGIVAMTVVNLITTPMEGFADMKRRAELVDIAEISMHRMAREIRHALPNSVCINRSGTTCNNNASGQTIEILHTMAGGRYKEASLDVSQATSSIDLEKNISNAGSVSTAAGDPDCGYVGKADCLAIYNLGQGQLNADAWQGSGFNGANLAAINSISATQIDYESNRFYYNSPQNRLMVVDKAVAFMCSGDKLYYDENYNFSNLPTNRYLLADKVTTSACQFEYTPGTLTRPGLVTIQIEINDSGEKISLLHQVFVENQP
ncbi:MAG: type II secretion system GspH family protein [Gammaproteobacteria bacterium]|nr:type II secretion system GspH family protein [Gammaproteobacteria bacterium]